MSSNVDGNRRFEIYDLLVEVGKQTGDPAFGRASRALNQQNPGRPPINDDRAMREAQRLYESRECRTLNAALLVVADTFYGYSNRRSTAERLRKKIKIKMQNLSAK